MALGIFHLWSPVNQFTHIAPQSWGTHPRLHPGVLLDRWAEPWRVYQGSTKFDEAVSGMQWQILLLGWFKISCLVWRLRRISVQVSRYGTPKWGSKPRDKTPTNLEQPCCFGDCTWLCSFEQEDLTVVKKPLCVLFSWPLVDHWNCFLFLQEKFP